MPHDFRVYGHLAGLNENELKSCLRHLSGYECEVSGQVLDFVHEGVFIDVDSDLDGLLHLVGPDVRGIIDIINHQDWEMYRCTLAGKALTRSRIALDNALDTAYASERRS
ncbi:hypothetical protein SAMN05421830_12036 [Desulfomicrobium norvegicum]|uniref:Uncharacterized protein n=1 Tax=Desulfomicrobium norvegicum (strain DSM 1741 / NCIMB 8310) TaxID=52561 RepID=A0A8G2F915_DESNO|nr:hypothetical protein [Desulfomicrobium norvegicum]SFM20310.1 hypothetical protein SAMN05421830_12036 [Desulfomicrobium norvegicum]